MKKRFLFWFVGQISMLTIFSLSILAMYFVEFFRDTEYESLYLRINGGVFWVSALLLLITSVMVSMERKRDIHFSRKRRKQLPGVISFFKNPFATIADLIAILSGIISVVLFIMDLKLLISRDYQILVFISIFIFSLSFGMHCILNGINYKYLKSSMGGKKSE